MSESEWWYNVKTHQVESDADRGKAVDRLGPYGSREEAEQALEKVARRNEAADADDDWGED